MPPQGKQVEIHRATLVDAEILASVGSESFREAYGPHSSAADVDAHIAQSFSAAAVRDAFAAGQSDYFLASVAGEPAGIAKIRLAECPVPGGDSNALELQQLYVLASLRRHGVGRELVGEIIQQAEAAGVAGVWLSAWEFADWAVRFYESVGFAAIGKVEFNLGATAYTDLLMWRPMQPPSSVQT